jgi:tetratricopeptide (TPR) repeat protein
MTDTFAQAREHHQAGNFRQAEEGYRRILRSEPRNGSVWMALAQLCEADHRPAEAVACFRQALEIEPRDAEGHLRLGNILLQQGKYGEAEAAYRRCLELRPDHVTALGNLGFVLAELDRLDEAKTCYQQALQHRGDLPEIHHNLGNVLREQGQLDQALACYQQALRLRPEYAKAYINRGIALVAQGRVDEAIRDLEHGVQLKPDLADAHTSLGAALSVQQRFDEALAQYELALALKPDHAEAAWNQSLIWLLRGEYERGWPAYEWRFRCKRTTTLPSFSQPRWDGSPLNGRTILLYGEQGLGDTLHFVRYARLVKTQGAADLRGPGPTPPQASLPTTHHSPLTTHYPAPLVILHCQNALLRLLSRTPGIDGLVGWGANPPPFDVWAPLMSLPALFHTTLETIPAEIPYVRPDPDLVAHWHRQLAPVRGFRVGIAWQGSPRHAWDRHRSVSLEHFEPLARIEGVHLISLQKGPGSEQLRACAGRFPVLSLEPLLDEASGPFMDTAAILANLDLVVSVDSALAHLAGAMGVPAWLALTYTPDWRWLLGREDNLWYPTLRLFRQPSLGDWPGVFRRIADALSREVAGRPQRRPICIEVAPGELLDKITILEIKSALITDAAKLRNVRLELAELSALCREGLPSSPELAELTAQLKAVNERLWKIEDEIRECERDQDFGPRFIELARSVYRENDRRAALKRAINDMLGSRLIEEKSYAGS